MITTLITERYSDMDPNSLRPPHEVRDEIKYAALVTAMEAKGWSGREILAVGNEDDAQALTGSHRVAAAQEAKLDTVPVLLLEHAEGLSQDELYEVEDTIDVLFNADDPDCLYQLRRIKTAPEAVKLMELEVASNDAQEDKVWTGTHLLELA